MQFGSDPNVVIMPDGKLQTLEGEDYTFSVSEFSGSPSSSGGDNDSGSHDSDSTGTTGEECSMVKADKSKVLRKKLKI